MPNLLHEIEGAHDRLFSAVMRQTSERHCLRLWSEFIRTRDARRCVVCHSTKNLSAHHIVRKSFFPQARLQRGNGITLCGDCHREPHKIFNGRPDMGQPMDAQGGDDNDLIMEYFGLLLKDATERNLLHTNYYFLHDRVLETFKKCLGFPADCQVPGTPLEQAYLIWRQTPPGQQAALLHANGFSVSHHADDYIKYPGITIRSSA
jgi:hypothetical protein